MTAEIADSLGMARPEGALVVSLHPQSPLAKAGLKRGDIILAIEGKPVENAQELGYRVATTEIGASTILEYQRGGKNGAHWRDQPFVGRGAFRRSTTARMNLSGSSRAGSAIIRATRSIQPAP